MISKISGKINKKSGNSLIININGLGYEVLVPLTVLNNIKRNSVGDDIELLTFHYLANEPARSTPVLIGFSNQIEKEFFEKFITVSGIGPKAAVRALSESISSIIQAIESSDIARLKRLPGVGEQRARQIVAKLQGKVGRFGLIQDGLEPDQTTIRKNIENEAIEVLCQLQYKEQEASLMVKRVFDKNPEIQTTEELLNEVYNQKKVSV